MRVVGGRSDAPLRATSAARDVDDLCGYLRIEHHQFERHQDRYFSALSALLCFHEITPTGEIVDAATFRNAVREFQQSVGLERDGIPGEKTLWELNYSWAMANRLGLSTVELDSSAGARGVLADPGNGQVAALVRTDMAQALRAWRSELLDAGVPLVAEVRSRHTITDENAFEQSCAAIHLTGLAVDLDPLTGMTSQGPIDPEDQPYTITDNGTSWRVWARSPAGTDVQLSAISWAHGASHVRQVEGRFLDLTAIAARHGMRPVAPAPSFPIHYEGAAWWHFEFHAGLVPWLSQFGCEVLRLKTNSESALRTNRLLWAERHRIFCCNRDGWGTRW